MTLLTAEKAQELLDNWRIGPSYQHRYMKAEAAPDLALTVIALQAKVNAADKLWRALDDSSMSDLESSDYRRVLAAFTAYREAKE